MRKQYHFRPSAAGLRAWDSDRLVALTKHIQPQLVPVASIRELDEPCWGEPMTCRHIAEHARLINEADLSLQLAVAKEAQYTREKDDLKQQMTKVLRQYFKNHNIPQNWDFDFDKLVFTPPSKK